MYTYFHSTRYCIFYVWKTLIYVCSAQVPRMKKKQVPWPKVCRNLSWSHRLWVNFLLVFVFFSEEHEIRCDNHGVMAAFWNLAEQRMTIYKWSTRGKREAKAKVKFNLDIREKQVHMTKVRELSWSKGNKNLLIILTYCNNSFLHVA